MSFKLSKVGSNARTLLRHSAGSGKVSFAGSIAAAAGAAVVDCAKAESEGKRENAKAIDNDNAITYLRFIETLAPT
ncbi:MAG: hypothetical protein DKT66_15795 [Candidatus Melainabacteria bacterium]|nr:MAG: hypothetical protein DKT66_15795 [Candidatus Melainabacteria bacterium]